MEFYVKQMNTAYCGHWFWAQLGRYLAIFCNQKNLPVSVGYPKAKPYLQFRKQGLIFHPYALPWFKVEAMPYEVVE